MYTGNVWGIALLIAGFLAALIGFQLLVAAVFARRAEAALCTLRQRPVASGLLGAFAIVVTIVAIAVLGLFGGPGKALGGLVAAFGPAVLPYLLLQAVFGFSLLEVVNYLEHYGLLRQKRDDGSGRYERTRPEHSWNSDNVSSNVLLYHLQRHSDHHAHPMRRFQALRHFEEAPELPSGYATMIVLALVPPLWRRVMDPRVDRYRAAPAQGGRP